MHPRITYVAAAATLAFLAACSGREPAESPRQPTAVTIHAKDFAYTMPDSVSAGYVAFTMINDGPTLHHATIIRLDSGNTMADLKAALPTPGPLPGWAVLLGGPNAPDPGSSATTTLELAPGNFAVVCFVDIPNGVPHFVSGMVHQLTVVAGSANAQGTPPMADIDLTLVDYAFRFSAPLTAGHHVISVTAQGSQPHEIEFLKMAPGKTAADVMAWIQKPEGPRPAAAIGGVAAAAPGRTTYFSVDLTAGDYLAVCFIRDAKDGKPHFMHGMMQTISIS